VRLGEIGLNDDLGRARVGHVDGSEVLGRAFVSQPQDAAAILGDLDRHAFAHTAEAVEFVMSQQFEVPDYRLVGILGPGHALSSQEIVSAP
jgi:hypothetical protein